MKCLQCHFRKGLHFETEWKYVGVLQSRECRDRKLKHDGAISIQSLRKKMEFMFLMFLLN